MSLGWKVMGPGVDFHCFACRFQSYICQYVYIYIHVCVCRCVYAYIYIYIYMGTFIDMDIPLQLEFFRVISCMCACASELQTCDSTARFGLKLKVCISHVL